MTNVGTGKPPPSNDTTENEDVLLPTGSNGNDGDDDANVESEEQKRCFGISIFGVTRDWIAGIARTPHHDAPLLYLFDA